MTITAAIEEVKALLVEGTDLAEAVAEVAGEYDLREVMLTNRVMLAIGTVEGYVATAKALRTVDAEMQRRMDLSENRAALAALGRVQVGSAGADKLFALVARNNELGGKAVVTHRRGRR